MLPSVTISPVPTFIAVPPIYLNVAVLATSISLLKKAFPANLEVEFSSNSPLIITLLLKVFSPL